MPARLNLRGVKRILDVGSGLGQFTHLMARHAEPGAAAIGIERHESQRSEAIRIMRQAPDKVAVEFRAGDALDLPLRADEWGTFDLVHARFLLEHVADPLAVVSQMFRAARPGGRIVLADDDHDVLRAWPEPPGLASVWRAYMKSYDIAGNDPIVGRRLVELLHQAGARPLRNTWVFFGSCAGHESWSLLTANLVEILCGARPSLVERGLISAASVDDALGEIEKWRQRPDAALWYAIAWAEGVRAPQ